MRDLSGGPFFLAMLLFFRPPPAPPPESSSPLTPPEPPDPPDPQICLSFNVSLTQSPLTTRNPLLPAKPRNSFGVLLLDESLFANWFGEMFPQVCLSFSFSNSSNMGSNLKFVECVVLVLWNSWLTQSISMNSDTFVFTFLLSSSTLIALLRSLTAVCRFSLDLARLEIVSWQLRHSSLFQFNRPAARNLLVFENRSITKANTLSKALYVAKLTCQAPKRGIPTTLPLIEAAPLSLPCIEGSSSRLHTPSALAVEALAIKSAKSALTAALRMEFTSITVCSDSQVLTSLLNIETTSNELQGILHDITCLCRSLLSFKFCFISRLANVSADATAKEALFSLDFPVCEEKGHYPTNGSREGRFFGRQDLDLGIDDIPIALSPEFVSQAAAVNRFSLIVTTVNPRKQNLRALIDQMPKVWSFADHCVGRIVGQGKVQFKFQSEESMNLVLRRGPWSFNDWMLCVHRWYPNITENEMKIIPFWVQIRGIPLLYLTNAMARVIGNRLGHVSDVDFDENTNQTGFVRVKVAWNFNNPLCFQRNIQFDMNDNTIIKFRFERLRNFCTKCGSLKHDVKECALAFEENGPDNEDEGYNDDHHNQDHDAQKMSDEDSLPSIDPTTLIPGLQRNTQTAFNQGSPSDSVPSNLAKVSDNATNEFAFVKRKRVSFKTLYNQAEAAEESAVLGHLRKKDRRVSFAASVTSPISMDGGAGDPVPPQPP
ncbi:Ribonuclease H domain [Arabidopsis suecica]|uniref:Ribonuclease H domain n=1 Tax=Arabidopsis suecica TaxID=45249 RepID=A0A8T2FCT9_ARASU|nr:Ribonuclease H domain [Arabidopsis suecica]